MGLDFHEHSVTRSARCAGTGPSTNWAVAARAALEQDQQAAQALTAARAATAQARSAVSGAVREVPPHRPTDLTTWTPPAPPTTRS